MDPLQEFCRRLHQQATPRRAHARPRMWEERDVLDGEVVEAFVLILRTRGCFWARHSGCSMCGYFRDSHPDMGEAGLRGQLEEALDRYRGQPMVKIFTSGSFLDPREVPADLQQVILDSFFEKARQVSIETRPEFVSRLEEVGVPAARTLEVAMGLESANDRVLEHSIGKGFTYRRWREGAEGVVDAGHPLKVYVLVKPPFLTEAEAIQDALLSAEKVGDIAHTVSFNPVAIHGYTLVDYLWYRGLYRPPWLWSVVEVLRRAPQVFPGSVKCDVVAGGQRRGAHNCGSCDALFLDAIAAATLQGKTGVWVSLHCGCREEWLDALEMEGFLQG
ncbi:MAG: archaeosine biosynthesis radical SAM protein RaSEA [Candidatus Thermoplasmatota archaeon]|nr:archaeosine biosynthesis radical SAM protein RaSEA [Candidatus Thermoplasmatota archaeon]